MLCTHAAVYRRMLVRQTPAGHIMSESDPISVESDPISAEYGVKRSRDQTLFTLDAGVSLISRKRKIIYISADAVKVRQILGHLRHFP